MKSLLTGILFLVIIVAGYSQKRRTAFEFSGFGNVDCYPEFSYVLNGRASTDYVNMSGISWGIDVIAKLPLADNWNFRLGAGFYKNNFNSIHRFNTNIGESSVRNIYYLSPLLINFHTDRYSYSDLAGIIGLEHIMRLKGNSLLKLAVDIRNYYLLSKDYHLISNPGGSQHYNRSAGGYGGFSGVLTSGYLKKWKRLEIGPFIRLPVVDVWKTDSVFPEETDGGTRNKVSRGFGLGICVGF